MFSLKIGQSRSSFRFSLAFLLLFVEWVRGAYLIAFLPNLVDEKLQLSVSIVGLAVSVHYLTDSLSKTFIGYLMDRYGTRMILHGGFILAGCGLALALMTRTSEGLILLSSSLMGLGLSPVWLVCMKQVSGPNRAEQVGKLYAYWMAGLGLGPVLFNFLIDGGKGWCNIVLVLALALGWTVGAFGCRTMDAGERTMVPQSVISQLRYVASYMKNNPYLLPAIVLQTTGAGIVVPFLSLFALERLALTHSQLSLVMILGGACVVLLLVPMGKWYDSSGSRWFLIGGFGLFAITLVALTGADSLSLTVILVAVMGLSYAMLLPAWNALMSRHVPDDASGTGWGVLSTIEGLGVVVGPLIGSFVYANGNLASPFHVSAVLFGIIGLSYLLMPARLFMPSKERSSCPSD
ncbi:MFS transporter [Paenibacillus sp. YAF4_2]|uniref:MFS transporter n=1 Tax=Paenibacillus sp. YAF4_2 TaxID=3233085 RepID=UPI003F9AF63B